MATFVYDGPPILDHDVPTDSELYDLLLIGLRFQRTVPPGIRESKILLGNMGNGVFIALEWLGVLTKAYREGLYKRVGLIGMVNANCEVVRHDKPFTRRDQREKIRTVRKDIVVPVPAQQLFAHARLIGSHGYRLFITDAGVQRVDDELRQKYPALTSEVFAHGWEQYRRQVRFTDISHTRARNVGAEGEAV